MSFLDSFSKVHIIGAGGIGVSAVARLLQHEGKTVTGSDVARNETVEELIVEGIPVAVGHEADNIPQGTDLVVYSDAVPVTNPERVEVRRRSIRELSYFQFLGEYSKEKWTIAVSGTNGKSTTTSMLGLMLERAGFDPTVIVGSKVPTFPHKNLRLGRSKFFVVEGCEHQAHMLNLSPKMIVLTNIEEDHLDFYRDIHHIRDTFQEYIERLPEDGKLILNADDHVSFSELKPAIPFVIYAIDNHADYSAKNLGVGDGMQTFQIWKHDKEVGDFQLHLPGKFNVANALAAATTALELGVPAEITAATLRDFHGIWRRFEIVGKRDDAIIISDYGHHPTAIQGTLEGAQQFYAGRRIVLAFQPHQHNRTKKLFNEFVMSFDAADVVILPDIYDVAGREETGDQKVSSQDLVDATVMRDGERNVHREIIYGGSLDETQKILETMIQKNDVVLLIGAGDIYKLGKCLVR